MGKPLRGRRSGAEGALHVLGEKRGVEAVLLSLSDEVSIPRRAKRGEVRVSCKPGFRSRDLVEFKGVPVPLRCLLHQGVQCVNITQAGQEALAGDRTAWVPRGSVVG